MKIKSKEIRECEHTDWKKTEVLEIQYTHRWKTGLIRIKDYDETLEEEYIKELRKAVRNLYAEQQLKA